jgi:hypothetical protein
MSIEIAGTMPIAARSTARLRDNEKPSSAALAQATRIGRNVVAAVEGRNDAIATHGLDAAFALPDANWGPQAPNDYLDAYQILRSLEWSELQFLRLRSQSFTGYSLLYMGESRGKRSIDPVPSDFDKRRLPAEIDPAVLAMWRTLTAGIPQCFTVSPPHMLGEVGWWVDGILVNSDTKAYQERMTLLYQCGVLDYVGRIKRPRILEIGGGYGALARAITKAFTLAEYWICDLPESLLFSGLYLALTETGSTSVMDHTLQPQPGINLMPNYWFPALAESSTSFDLVINTLAMSEMSPHQIEQYARGISKLIGTTGYFFEQNQDNRHMGLSDCKEEVAKHFTSRRRILTSLPIHNGAADLWSNLY